MQQSIQKKDLIEEIRAALADEFVATVTQEETGLVLAFPSGQSFRLSVEEL